MTLPKRIEVMAEKAYPRPSQECFPDANYDRRCGFRYGFDAALELPEIAQLETVMLKSADYLIGAKLASDNTALQNEIDQVLKEMKCALKSWQEFKKNE